MKVHIEIDMTPQEARKAMGLPDIEGLQKQMLEEMQARIKAAFDTGDPEAMMRVWMPLANGYGANGIGGGAQAFEQFQKFFWDSAQTIAGKAAAGGSKKDAKT